MKKLFTNEQMRAADMATISNGISAETLMRRAGVALANNVIQVANDIAAKSIVVVCGVGNNGGDGYVCAQELYKSGLNVSVYAFEGNLFCDCLREKQRYQGAYTTFLQADIIVDCIFGTGLRRNVEQPYLDVIAEINALGAFVISADIPSGLNGDNGIPCGIAVQANLTVAIAQEKVGLYLNDGVDYCGKIVVADIGIDGENYICALMEEKDAATAFPKRKRNTHKGNYGSCSILAGQTYLGAGVLALSSAVLSGCGYVKFTCDFNTKLALVAAYPQVMYSEDADLSANAIAFGMGSGINQETCEQLTYLLTNYQGKLIIDADGLNCLAKIGIDVLKQKTCEVLLTPHWKEFSRLSEKSVTEIANNPVRLAQDFAKEYGVTVLLKSATAIITDGNDTAISARGSSALAKGGSGDYLSGFIAGCAARGLSLWRAAACSHYVLGAAAELATERYGDYCATYQNVLECLPQVIKKF